jgi:hypothetical protein
MNYTTFDEVLQHYAIRQSLEGNDKVVLNSKEVKDIIPTLNNLIQIELKKDNKEEELLAKLFHNDEKYLIKARVDYHMNGDYTVFIQYIVR